MPAQVQQGRRRRSDPSPYSRIPRLEDYENTPNRLRCEKGGRSCESPLSDPKPGLVTVITVVRNSVITLPRTIDSIRAQSYPHVEYIVIDGGSTDGTLDILRQRSAGIELWLSEPDRGISDAFNKGIALASGEFIALVNADDWLEPDHISLSVESLTRTGAAFSFADLIVHDDTGAPLYKSVGDERYALRLHHAMPALNHPSIVCRRDVYAQHGLYDLSYKIAMDYEWLLRNHRLGATGIYVPSLTSHMGAAGISQRDVRTSLSEVRTASVSYGYPAALALLRYYGRLFRANVRMIMERYLPQAFTDALRTTINSSYRPTTSRPAPFT